MADIFISYASEDRDRVETLAKALEEQGWSVFWDRTIPPGKTWREVIGAKLNIVKCIIVLWSTHSERSRWVIEEADFGVNRDMLIPVKIENVNPPFGFVSIQAADLTDWETDTSHPGFISLLNTISEFAGPPKADPKSFTNSIGMTFVLIPAGNFMMSSKLSPEKIAKKYGGKAERYEDEYPQHEVIISKPFYIQSTQVTQGQWKRIMGENPSRFKKLGDDFPVERVSWYDTQKFLEILNQVEDTNTYRFPTEAEWEYACRAGTTTEFSFGDDAVMRDEVMLTEYAWFKLISNYCTHRVGTKKPNNWGLYDMHGNVWEWCQDRYGDYPSGQVTDPAGPYSGKYRVLRGGSWSSGWGFARCAFRDRADPNLRTASLGFRCAKTIK